MRIVLLRHAEAGDRDKWIEAGKKDEKRPLTAEGKKSFKKAAKKIAKIVPRAKVIATSPYLRCRQTAKIVSQYIDHDAVEVWDELAHAYSKLKLEKKLLEFKGKTILLIGHSPDLSELAARLLKIANETNIKIEKGGCLSIVKDESRSYLEWLLPPGIIDQISRSK